jgi:hypothetical protein
MIRLHGIGPGGELRGHREFIHRRYAPASLFTDRMETTLLVPSGDDGLNFKIVVDTLISVSSFTDIQDYVPDLGRLPAGAA